MNNRVVLFIFLILVCEGCASTSSWNPSLLPTDEIEKVQALRLIEANELDKHSYKIIKKVKSISFGKRKLKKRGWFANEYSFESASRKEAVGQVKILAALAGANAITNMVCITGYLFHRCSLDYFMHCSIYCTADAIQVD